METIGQLKRNMQNHKHYNPTYYIIPVAIIKQVGIGTVVGICIYSRRCAYIENKSKYR